MKRLVAFIGFGVISVAMLLVFALVVVSIRSAVVTIWQLAREMYSTRHDWWLGALIIFCLIWSAIRWKSAYRALREFE